MLGVLIPYNLHVCCLLSWSEEIRTATSNLNFLKPQVAACVLITCRPAVESMLQRLVWEVQKMRSSGKLGMQQNHRTRYRKHDAKSR